MGIIHSAKTYNAKVLRSNRKKGGKIKINCAQMSFFSFLFCVLVKNHAAKMLHFYQKNRK
jgi:hypothetical protein